MRPARAQWRLLFDRFLKLRKKLSRDREVEYWEQQLQGPSEDVPFGGKNPPSISCNITFQTLNANGLRLYEDGGSNLLEVLNQEMVNRSVNVLLI